MSAPDYSLVVQGSEEWQQLRCGNVTASRAAAVIAMLKGNKGEAAPRRDYRTEIICERLTGIPYPQSAQYARAVQWGKEHEGEARAAYELKLGVLVDVVGFVMHPTIARFACSPDFLVGEEGMGQIKCPDTATHIDWLRAGTVPIEHMPQMLAEMSCCERDWCDFVSFDPRLPEHLQLFVVRYDRDEKLVKALEAEIEHFNAEVDQVIACLPQGPQPVAQLLEMPLRDEIQIGEF